MADPVTASLVIFAAATKTLGVMNAAKFNEKVANQNKVISAQQTASAVDAQKRDNIRRMGAARAARGASGITIEGSPLDIFEENAYNSEMDILNIKYNGALQDRKYTNDATQYKKEQKTAMLQGIIGGGFKAGNAAGGGGVV